MKNTILLFYIFPIFCISQVQIGNDIDGANQLDESRVVALSDDGLIVAIGSPRNDDNGQNAGHVRVFQYSSNIWSQVGGNIDGEASGDFSGNSVALSADGSILAIGAQNNDGNGTNSGHVRVYENNSGNWTQLGADIDGESSGDKSGFRVALSDSGTILAISAIDNDGGGSDSGHVRVYENNEGSWSQLGADIDGESSGDESGYGLSLSSDGSIVAIGARLNDDNGTNSGKVKVYQYNENSWTQLGQGIEGDLFDQSGNSVSLSSNGNVVAVGAFANSDNANASGQVKVYQNNAGTWIQIGQDINGLAELDLSGTSVSLSFDGYILAIGAPGNNSDNNEGYVRVFQNNSGNWTQVGEVIYGEAMLDYSGGSISLSSDATILAIGASGNNGNGGDSGHVRIFDLSAVLSSDEFVQTNFKLYPNPSSNYVNIQLYENMILKQVNLYAISGELIKTVKTNIIPVEDLNSGNYLLEVITNQGKASKIIVVK